MEHYKLTKNQQEVFDRVENEPRNFFITGKPGVGKSVLINALVKDGNKSYSLAAPTGLAALNIGGRTLHSIFRPPMSDGIIPEDYNVFNADDRCVNNIRYNITNLIIDEVSMVRADLFDFIDRMLRHVKGKDIPFGGVQLIIVGDPYQLAPVTKGNEAQQLRNDGIVSPFFFSARCYRNFEVLVLDEVLRQKGDTKFLKVLNSARTGDVTDPQINLLNKQVGHPGDIRINLCGTNRQAEEINIGHLSNIDNELLLYVGAKFGEWPALPAEELLHLKVGAQIMVKQNGADRPPQHKGPFNPKVVNGTLGIIIKMELHSVDIKLRNGDSCTIYRRRWERSRKFKNGDGKWEEQVIASYEQIPLALAWAISIHKSQGQSFDYCHVDASKIFVAGQLYVALSRVRSLAGLSLQAPVTAGKFYANPKVVEFYEELEV